MEQLLSTVPDDADLDHDDQSRKTIDNIISIEEEWIIDPDLREELSLIDFN